MVTEAFSGARAPITFTGDHISGLFPNCHVVPRTTFNLVALGPFLDHRGPNHAVILTATSALELANVNFDTVASAPDPRQNLIQQLQHKNRQGHFTVGITTIGTRAGPGSLYNTNLFDTMTAPDIRAKLVNSAITGLPIDKSSLNNLINKSLSRTTTAHSTQVSPKNPVSKSNIPDHSKQWTSSTSTEKALIELRHLHCALGHPYDDVLLQALADSASKRHLQLRKYVKLMDPCNVCPMGTQRSEPHPAMATTRASKFLDRLILDCSGRQPVATISGSWYFLLIVDDATRMKWARPLKSIKQVAHVFDDFLRTTVRQGTTGAKGCVQSVRTDNGPEFDCDKFRQVLRHHSITTEPSPPDASHQRGIAERGIGVLSAIARAGLAWSKAPLPFWGECIVNHAVPTSNNRPNSANPGNKSPYQMANPSRPSQLHKLRPFGCLAFNLVKVTDRNGKLNPASSCGFFAGYGLTPDGTINGYRIMNFKTQRFTTKINVRFNVQLPALRYALSALVHSPQQMLVGRTIEKKFSQGYFTGKITGFSTLDNVTLYDIVYSDGDSEQMDLLDVLRHITPVQQDMSIKRPHMHKRLRQSTKHDRSRLGKDVLPAISSQPSPATSTPPTATAPTSTTPKTTTTTAPPPSDTSASILPRKSTGTVSTPNRLTSTTLGSLANSSAVPPILPTHKSNKANASRIPLSEKHRRWRSSHTGKFTILPMVTMLINAVTASTPTIFPPNATINGIHLHRFNTRTPPLPKMPPRDVPLPTSFDDAVYGPYARYWRPAIQNEIDSLFRHDVWRLEPLPPGVLVLPCKLVFKVKPDGRDPPGIDKFKCRYCGKGFVQVKGIHYIDSYAPVAPGVAIRIIVAIATEMNWPLHGMDVSNAYLNAPLEPEIVLFVKPPPTIHVPKGYGLRLLRGLYGTMQGGNR